MTLEIINKAMDTKLTCFKLSNRYFDTVAMMVQHAEPITSTCCLRVKNQLWCCLHVNFFLTLVSLFCQPSDVHKLLVMRLSFKYKAWVKRLKKTPTYSPPYMILHDCWIKITHRHHTSHCWTTASVANWWKTTTTTTKSTRTFRSWVQINTRLTYKHETTWV